MPTAVAVGFVNNCMVVTLSDDRSLVAPLEWFPRLSDGTEAERNNWEIFGDGLGIHWPALDEDISVAGLLRSCGQIEPKS